MLCVAIVVLFVGYAFIFLWQLENEGIAINKAGSLRMRTYRMVVLLNQENNLTELKKTQDDFETIIEELRIMRRDGFMLLDTRAIDEQTQAVNRQWQEKIKPLIALCLARLDKTPISDKDFQQFDQFVEIIDQFVTLIETQNTQRINWLRFIQSMFIIMVIISAFAGVYMLYCLVIRPLEHIKTGLHELRQGNLGKRLLVASRDEFGVVAVGFNAMADNLQDLYSNLEQKVSEKTADLEEKNRELSSLYDMTAFFHETHALKATAQTFLQKVIELSRADAGSVRLVDQTRQRLNYAHSRGVPDELIGLQDCISMSDCDCGKGLDQMFCFKQSSCMIKIDAEDCRPCRRFGFSYLYLLNIGCRDQSIGLVTLYFKNAKVAPLAHRTLLETLAGQLAISLENQRLATKDRQVAVMEERNLIAQGLHDSIAQSLSFLNMQVQMLQSALKNKNTEQADKNIGFIKQGLEESYDDVRELLLNFRTSVHDNDFTQTIQNLLDRFTAQTQISATLSMTEGMPSLTPEQQSQIAFILQEALSNIRKHAECTSVCIIFEEQDDFRMIVKDNGCGFAAEDILTKRTQHVGLSIMAERAMQIAAVIDVQSVVGEGTTVMLIMPREQKRNF